MSSPSGLTVSKEDSLAEPCPRLEIWSSIPSCGTGSFSMHTLSSLHFTHKTLNFSILCPSPVCQQGIYRSHQQFPLFLSLLFPLLPFLQMSRNPMSNLAEAATLKTSHQELAHSPALLDICRLLWSQGKSKEVVMFLIKKKSLIYLLLFLLLLLLILQSGHLDLQERYLRKLSAAVQHSLCLAEGRGDA